ncbi:MAG: sulfotransferase domain-containing protein [Hyphomicrobiaceae bacterium]|nr:sulfotransferase domain-containing protein [Hyphomicrobiaceae bacterium]
MLLLFAGGHRMGSTYQTLIVRHALRQKRVPVRQTDNSALNVFHLDKIKAAFAEADRHPEAIYFAKAHPAFPAQVETVLGAQHLRVFLVWREQTDALVSDFHYAQRRAGHRYKSFDSYFRRRGRKILLRNRLQEVVWSKVNDPRVRAWRYLDLVEDFERSAAAMIEFAGVRDVDIVALHQSVAIKELRKAYNDPNGTFFRSGGRQNLEDLSPGPRTRAAIAEIAAETDIDRLAKAFEREDWMRIAALGRESTPAGRRKTLHWWLFKTRTAQGWRANLLPKLYRLSPRRLLD